MKHRSLFIIGITCIVFAMVFAACGANDEEPDITPNITEPKITKPDITELNEKLARAERAKEGLKIATSAGEVGDDVWWISPVIMRDFEQDLNWYYRRRNAATQDEVDLATIALSNLIDTFSKAIAKGDRKRIGTVTGTVTLTGVSSPAQELYISLYSHRTDLGSLQSDIYPVDLSSGYSNIPWSIPVYEGEGSSFYEGDTLVEFKGEEFFGGSTGILDLFVLPPEKDGYSIKISTIGGNSIIIKDPAYDKEERDSGSFDAGDLGSIRINPIILEGTINVTYNGMRVPYVKIEAVYNYVNKLGSTELAQPEAGAKWSIEAIPVTSAVTVTFRVYGYRNSQMWDQLFPPIEFANPKVSVSGMDVSGIVIDETAEYEPVDPVTITAGQWKNGEIKNAGDVDWYSMDVAQGTKYYLWWNDKEDGDNSKTLDIDVYALYDKNSLISLTDNDKAWDTPVSFTATKAGKVYLRVRAYGGVNYMVENNVPIEIKGTYAIAYNTSNTRP